MATTNETARSGKTQALREVLEQMGYLQPNELPENDDERLEALLTGTQFLMKGDYTLIMEDWDWLVVLQWMQDYHFIKSNPKRPPFKLFIQWLQDHHIPQRMTQHDMRTMSYVHNRIKGKRFPWADVKWQPHIIHRWRVLYEQLTRGMKSLSYNDL